MIRTTPHQLALFLVTFACFPIITEHVAIGTGAKSRSERVETGMRTTEIISQTALV